MEFIGGIGTGMSQFIFWASSFLTQEQMPGWISILILCWLALSVLMVLLSTRLKIDTLRWLNGLIAKTNNEEEFTAQSPQIDSEVKSRRTRKGYAHITAAWSEFRETLVLDETVSLGNLFPLVQGSHQLAYAVDQDIAVMNRRKTIDRRLNRNLDTVVLILPDSRIRLGREREDRVFHRGHVCLWNGVEDVAHEEVTLRISIRQERRAVYYMIVRHRETFRTFTHVSAGRARNLRGFVLSHTRGAFVLLPTPYRTFTHILSYFHTRAPQNKLFISTT